MFEAVLFDLDGTLADTAPDLGAAANFLLQNEGRPPKPLSELRPYTSQGVRGLLKASFDIEPENERYDLLAQRFLDRYAEYLCIDTCLFPGIAELLDALDQHRIPWGIVTNKRMRFTDPLVRQLGLFPRTPCVVSGDTTHEAKPSPQPIRHACQLLACAPERTVYIGDDRRDIEAGRAAGCRTIAVRYGYLGHSGSLESWGADWNIDTPAQLLPLLVPQR